jgi:hypothetical protein
MYEIPDICVEHRGQTKCFPAVFTQTGFSYRITVTVNGIQVIFEPDEEREWRARVENNAPAKHLHELIPLIAEQLKELFK